MRTTQSKHGRRFDEEFKREVAALANKPGAKQEQVARDLGVSPYSVSRWKKLCTDAPAGSAAGVKGELIGDHVFATRAEAKSALFDYTQGLLQPAAPQRPRLPMACGL